MSAPRISRLRRIPSLATLLLALQALAGGAVTLADAREPLTVASHIEARHAPGCPVVHDAWRCALCHYAGTRLVVQRTAITVQDHPVPTVAPRLDPVLVVAVAAHFTASPRAPPLFLS